MPYFCHHCKARFICPAFAESPPHGRLRGDFPSVTASYSMNFSTISRIVGGYSTIYERPTETEIAYMTTIKECDKKIEQLKQSIAKLEAKLKKFGSQ